GLHAECFTQAEEVVGLIVKADEGSAETADATVETDRVLALFLDLKEKIDGAILGILVGFGVLLDLQGIEIIELVETEETQLPEMAVVDGAFFEQQLAADDEV